MTDFTRLNQLAATLHALVDFHQQAHFAANRRYRRLRRSHGTIPDGTNPTPLHADWQQIASFPAQLEMVVEMHEYKNGAGGFGYTLYFRVREGSVIWEKGINIGFQSGRTFPWRRVPARR